MESPYLQRHIPELDGLRGIAIILVIAYHFGLWVHLPNAYRTATSFGWSGVDLFFVLSGFLIGGILIDKRGAPNYFKAFYARRFFRIVPLYLLILSVYGAFWVFSDPAHEVMRYYFSAPMPWYAYLTFTNNFWIAAHNNWDVFIGGTWSLAIEEQFYLTLPLIVWLVKPKYLLSLACTLTAAILYCRAYAGHAGLISHNQAFVLPWFRGDALLIGVICAILVREENVRSFLYRHIWALYVALLALGLAWYQIGGTLGGDAGDAKEPLLMFGLTVIALFWAMVLLIAVVHPGPLRALANRPLMEVGKVSYFLYLLHGAGCYSIVQLLRHLGGARSFSNYEAMFIFGVGLFATFILAQMSWGLFESQMIRVGYRFHFVPPSHQLIPGAEVPVPVAAGA
jgi:peptidoglycan/LPS O-acetylase OafA/YrhL